MYEDNSRPGLDLASVGASDVRERFVVGYLLAEGRLGCFAHVAQQIPVATEFGHHHQPRLKTNDAMDFNDIGMTELASNF